MKLIGPYMKFILTWTDNCKTHFQVIKKNYKMVCLQHTHYVCDIQIPLVTFKKTNSLGHEADNFLQGNCVPNLTSSASKQLRAFIILLSLSLVRSSRHYLCKLTQVSAMECRFYETKTWRATLARTSSGINWLQMTSFTTPQFEVLTVILWGEGTDDQSCGLTGKWQKIEYLQ